MRHHPSRSCRSSHHASRSSYYEPTSRNDCEYFGAGVREKIMANGGSSAQNDDSAANGSSLFKRSSSRSSTKKSPRPHSWHSTLQRGFHRARSRSTGRDRKESGNPDSSLANGGRRSGNSGSSSNRNSRCGKDFYQSHLHKIMNLDEWLHLFVLTFVPAMGKATAG